jgi:hypothetical protein
MHAKSIATQMSDDELLSSIAIAESHGADEAAVKMADKVPSGKSRKAGD